MEGKLRWIFNLAHKALCSPPGSLLLSHFSQLPFLRILHFIYSQLVEVAYFFSPHLCTANLLHRTFSLENLSWRPGLGQVAFLYALSHSVWHSSKSLGSVTSGFPSGGTWLHSLLDCQVSGAVLIHAGRYLLKAEWQKLFITYLVPDHIAEHAAAALVQWRGSLSTHCGCK